MHRKSHPGETQKSKCLGDCDENTTQPINPTNPWEPHTKVSCGSNKTVDPDFVAEGEESEESEKTTCVAPVMDSSSTQQHCKGEPSDCGDNVMPRKTLFTFCSLPSMVAMGLFGFLMLVIDGTTANALMVLSYRFPEYQEPKPIIYQFDTVSWWDHDISNTAKTAGAGRMPTVWMEIWESAGWVPKKLTLRQVSKIPEYQLLVEKIAARLSNQQHRYILKYLAMHSVGGGWVAHSDTYPLHDFRNPSLLPNNGKLTVYDASFPSIMSGSAEEWLRMAHLLVEHAENFSDPKEWNEAVALQEIRSDTTVVEWEVYDVTIISTAKDWMWNPKDCQATVSKRAVHFCLDAKEQDGVRSMDDSADRVIQWLSMWQRSCEKSKYFLVKDRQDNEVVSSMPRNTLFGPFVKKKPVHNYSIESTIHKMTSQSHQQVMDALNAHSVSNDDVVAAKERFPMQQAAVSTQDVIRGLPSYQPTIESEGRSMLRESIRPNSRR